MLNRLSEGEQLFQVRVAEVAVVSHPWHRGQLLKRNRAQQEPGSAALVPARAYTLQSLQYKTDSTSRLAEYLLPPLQRLLRQRQQAVADAPYAVDGG